MAVVGRANIFLGADTASFTSKMDRARRDLSSSSAKMNRSLAAVDRGFKRVGKSATTFAKRMGGIRGAIGLLAGTGGLALLIKRSIDTADKIGKTADAIGVTTKTLQQYRLALDIAGVSMESTDKGLKKFVKNMGELGKSSSETQTTLRDLDPTLLANLKSLKSVEAQLKLGFRALAGYTSQQKNAAVGAALFGKAGIDMTVAVKGGITAFEKMTQGALDLGFVIEDSVIRKAEQTKNELTLLEKQIEVDTVGAMLELQEVMVGLKAVWAGFLQQLADTPRALDEIRGLTGLSPLEKEFALAAQRVGELNREINQLNAAIEETEVDPDMGAARRVFLEEDLAPLLDKRRAALKELADINRLIQVAAEKATAATDDQTAAIEGQTKAVEIQTDRVGDFIAGLRNQNKLMLLDGAAREKVLAVQKAQEIAMARGNLLRLDEISAIRAAIDEHQELTKQIEAQATAATEMQAAQEKAAQVGQEQADAMARPCEEAKPVTQRRYRERIQNIFREAIS